MTAWLLGMEAALEENRVLRANLLALKRLLLEQRAAAGAEPVRQRARHDGSADECARLRAALARAFRECQAAAAERDAWRARCAEQARAAAQREDELGALRAVVAESELAQRAAERALKKAHDFERRVHSQFVSRSSYLTMCAHV